MVRVTRGCPDYFFSAHMQTHTIPERGWKRFVPGIAMLRNYDRAYLRVELIAGLTVFALLVPSAMAYGELAGVNPVQGLYNALGAMALYAFFGTSRYLIIGPDATSAILVASAIAPLAGGDPTRYAALAAALAILIGFFSILAGIGRLGFVADLLSKPILIGYITGTTLIVIESQLPKLFGISLNAEGFFAQLIELVLKLPETHWLTLAIGVITIAGLLLIRRINRALPGPLFAVALGIIVSQWLDLEAYGVAVVGPVPAGLPTPTIPAVGIEEIISLLPAALALTIFVYADEILTARTFAKRHNQRVNANQELIAIGMGNIGAGLLQGFTAATSSSRTVVNEQMGGKTQVVGLATCAFVIIFLLFFTPLLAPLPTVVLGAIIIVSALGLLDPEAFRFLRRVRAVEFWLAVVTLFGVLIIGIIGGILLAVTLSLVNVLYRVSRPHAAVLDDVAAAGGIVYRGVAPETNAQAEPGLIVYRFDAPLVFANAQYFEQQVSTLIDNAGADLRCFVLDAEAISDMDTTSLETLEELNADLERKGVEFWIARANAPLRASFQAAGLTGKIGAENIFPSVRAAVDAYARKYPRAGTAGRTA